MENDEALMKLIELRQPWMDRNDLLMRASRHYEGAMLAFIRQAVSSFNSNELNVIICQLFLMAII